MSIPYNLSMMTNKHELETDKHLNMTFIEFIEVLARVAEKFDQSRLKDWIPEFKAKQRSGLDKKVESVCLILM